MADKVWEFHGECKLDFAIEVKAASPRKALELLREELEKRLTEVDSKHRKVVIKEMMAPRPVHPHYGFLEIHTAYDEEGNALDPKRYE